MTLAELNKGERAIIEDLVTDSVPLKLIEMGCGLEEQVPLQLILQTSMQYIPQRLLRSRTDSYSLH